MSAKDKYKDIEDCRLKWDLIKMELRGFSIAYAKRKASKENSRNNPHYLHELHKLQAELNKIMETKLKERSKLN